MHSWKIEKKNSNIDFSFYLDGKDGKDGLPFISVPATLGQAWYLREILVLMVQLSRLEGGELQEPRPKSYEKC